MNIYEFMTSYPGLSLFIAFLVCWVIVNKVGHYLLVSRLERVVALMRARATESPEGISSERVVILAREIELAFKQ